jgi:hypothetical protein
MEEDLLIERPYKLSHSSEPVSLRAVGSPEVKQKDYRTIPKT